MKPIAAGDREAIAEYEELRKQAREHTGRRNIGYTFLVRHGVAAWAAVWRSYISEPREAPPVDAKPDLLPLEMRSQLALVLAGIILNLQKQEVPSW